MQHYGYPYGIHYGHMTHREWAPPCAHRAYHDALYRKISLEEAIQIARRQVPGEVVSAEVDRKGGRMIYEVEIVADANNLQYEVKIDAETGQVLEIELD